MWISSSSLQGYCSPKNYDMTSDNDKLEVSLQVSSLVRPNITLLSQEVRGVVRNLPGDHPLSTDIVKTFEQILGETVLANKLF